MVNGNSIQRSITVIKEKETDAKKSNPTATIKVANLPGRKASLPFSVMGIAFSIPKRPPNTQ